MMNAAMSRNGTADGLPVGQNGAASFYPWLFGILLIATALRLIFFHGMMGSDDLVYFTRAAEIASGVWSSADYNGSLRYGFNIPAGLSLYLFGANVFAANLFSLLCSLGEIVLVGYYARRYWGARAGLFAALILSVIPLHVAAATSIHTDPIAAFFITASFVAFWRATESGSRLGFFATGLLVGFVFWVKELIIVYVAVFLLYALIERRWDWRWLYVLLGGLVMLAGHLVLMWAIAGDPFHGFKVYFMQIDRDFVGGAKESGAFYYFRYMFLDFRHTWLVPYLALAGVAGILLRRTARQSADNRFLLVWLAGLLALFSFTPISMAPFQFITKQSNYLNLFFAPLAVAAAVFFAGRSRAWTVPILAVTIAGGVALAALGQQDLRKFVANSKAVARFAAEHPDAVIYGSVNNRNVASFYALLQPEPAGRVELLRDLKPQQDAGGKSVYVVIDGETAHWGKAATGTTEPKSCWQLVKTLTPEDYGLGRTVVQAIVWTTRLIPGRFGTKVSRPFQALLSPSPAKLYTAPATDPWCNG